MAEATRAVSRVDVLAGLEPADLARFLAACRPLSLATGERVFAEGDDGDELFVVRTGRIRLEKAIAKGVARTVAHLGPGGLFGELAMVDAGPRSASAVAVEDTEVVALGREAFRTLAAERPSLALTVLGRFAATLAERLRLTNDLLRDALAWGQEISGAASLNLAEAMRLRTDLVLTLSTGREIPGRLLKVERGVLGVELLLKDENDRIHLIPYHSLTAISFGGRSAEAPEEI